MLRGPLGAVTAAAALGTAVVRAGLFCVLWSSCALNSRLLVRNRSLLRAGPWANAAERDTHPYFFWLKNAGLAQGRQKILPTYLGSWGVCRHQIKICPLGGLLSLFGMVCAGWLSVSFGSCCCSRVALGPSLLVGVLVMVFEITADTDRR